MLKKPIICELSSGIFSNIHGEFVMHAFTDGYQQSVVLTLGKYYGKRKYCM